MMNTVNQGISCQVISGESWFHNSDIVLVSQCRMLASADARE